MDGIIEGAYVVEHVLDAMFFLKLKLKEDKKDWNSWNEVFVLQRF